MSFLLFSCVFRWFWRDLVKCFVSVQVTYLLDNKGFSCFFFFFFFFEGFHCVPEREPFCGFH